MLGSIQASNINQCSTKAPEEPLYPPRYNRNEKDDMQEAVKYLYEFKEKLDKLHPNCVNLIEQMLQHRRY